MKLNELVINNDSNDNIYKPICNKRYCCAIIVEPSLLDMVKCITRYSGNLIEVMLGNEVLLVTEISNSDGLAYRVNKQ